MKILRFLWKYKIGALAGGLYVISTFLFIAPGKTFGLGAEPLSSFDALGAPVLYVYPLLAVLLFFIFFTIFSPELDSPADILIGDIASWLAILGVLIFFVIIGIYGELIIRGMLNKPK